MSWCSQSLLQRAAGEINQTASLLSQQADLSPANHIINQSLSRLVENLSIWSAQPNMHSLLCLAEVQDALHKLPSICGLAECEMEKWWAKRLLAEPENIWQAIEQFWYIQQYRHLVDSELKLLGSLRVNSFAFLGSGALPLTALLLAKHYSRVNSQVKIICIDSDPLACDLSQALIRCCGMGDIITVLNMPAANYEPKKDCLVICASLLKSMDLYTHLFTMGVKNVLVRDVEGIYRFLYQLAPYPSSDLYTEVSQTSFCQNRINISRLFRKMEVL